MDEVTNQQAEEIRKQLLSVKKARKKGVEGHTIEELDAALKKILNS